MERKREYKQKKQPFSSEEAKLKRLQKFEEKRRLQRDVQSSKFRDISVEEEKSVIEDVNEKQTENVNKRKIKLMEWKAERDLQKKLEAKNKKPIFKIGVPHHNFYSPKMKDSHDCHRKSKMTPAAPIVKKISRVTERRLAAKAEAAASMSTTLTSQTGMTPVARSTRSHKKPTTLSSEPSKIEERKKNTKTIPLFGQTELLLESDSPEKVHSKTDLHNEDNSIEREEEEEKEEDDDEKEIVENQQKELFNEEKCLINSYSTSITEDAEIADSSVESIALRLSSECIPADGNELGDGSNNEENLELQKKNMETPPQIASPVAAQFSPFVCMSRGKSSARKEMKKRMSSRMSCSPLDAEIPTKETVMQNLNISTEEEVNTAQYYRSLADREEYRLQGLCDEWEDIKNQSDMIEEGIYHINSATGQANLLIRKKFGRFLQLVADCETGKGERLVRCRDLQGFWELIAREIADCDSRFSKLHTLRANNWIEEEIEMKPVQKKKTVITKKKITSASSKMREFIEAQRRKKFGIPEKMMIENDENEAENQIESPKVSIVNKNSSDSIISSPQTNVKFPSRSSPFKRVQLTDSAKKLALASIQIAQSCKTPEVLLDQSISYINSDQTPGRGILKKPTEVPNSEARLIKSVFKVNFNDTVSTKEDEIIEEKIPSFKPQRLSTIDLVSNPSDDESEKESLKINKKLDFEDDSFIADDDAAFEEEKEEELEKTTNQKKSPTLKKTEDRKKNSNDLRQKSPVIEIIPPTPAIEARISPIQFNTEGSPSRRLKKNNKIASVESTSFPKTPSVPVIEIIEATPQIRRRSTRIKSHLNSTIDQDNSFTSEVKRKSPEKVTSVSRRKSTRKSTNKNVEDNRADCSIALPITPIITPRRKKKMSMPGGDTISKSLVDEDLISFESPLRVSTRLRRKSMK